MTSVTELETLAGIPPFSEQERLLEPRYRRIIFKKGAHSDQEIGDFFDLLKPGQAKQLRPPMFPVWKLEHPAEGVHAYVRHAIGDVSHSDVYHLNVYVCKNIDGVIARVANDPRYR